MGTVRGDTSYRYCMGRLHLAFLFFTVIIGLVAAAQEASTTVPATTQDSETSLVTSPPKSELAAIDLVPDANGSLSQQQMQKVFHVVAEKNLENDKRLRDYTYIERDVEHRVDGKGKVKSTEVKTYEVMQIDGEQINRLIQKDDKPLSEKEAAKEEQRIQKIIDKRKNESEDDRKKRLAKEEKSREDGRKFVLEIADAYYFKLVGTESVGGRDTWVIDADPRPDFVPHMKESRFLSKFRGRFWVDKEDLQLAKMDVEAIDDVSVGWFLVRLHKGAHFIYEQTRVNDEVWLPLHLTFNIDARIALLKAFRADGEQSFSAYKKFRSSTKIVGYEEIKDP